MLCSKLLLAFSSIFLACIRKQSRFPTIIFLWSYLLFCGLLVPPPFFPKKNSWLSYFWSLYVCVRQSMEKLHSTLSHKSSSSSLFFLHRYLRPLLTAAAPSCGGHRHTKDQSGCCYCPALPHTQAIWVGRREKITFFSYLYCYGTILLSWKHSGEREGATCVLPIVRRRSTPLSLKYVIWWKMYYARLARTKT